MAPPHQTLGSRWELFEYLGKNKPPFMNRNIIVCGWRFDSFQSDPTQTGTSEKRL